MPNSPQFIHASTVVKNLKNKPDNETLACLYGLYKQATLGNNTTMKPHMLDFIGLSKWKYWNKFNGLSPHQSEIEYIKIVNKLISQE